MDLAEGLVIRRNMGRKFEEEKEKETKSRCRSESCAIMSLLPISV